MFISIGTEINRWGRGRRGEHFCIFYNFIVSYLQIYNKILVSAKKSTLFKVIETGIVLDSYTDRSNAYA